jgi:hypothetical protein
MISHLLRDVRIGVRLLWRQPAFTTIALLALALGVAANTAIFSVVSATLLAPLPYEHPDELTTWRLVLNANRGHVLRDGMATSLMGVVLGSMSAYLAGGAMKGMLSGVGAIDPRAFSIVTGLLLACAMLACLIPAMRAASVDPMTALRQE